VQPSNVLGVGTCAESVLDLEPGLPRRTYSPGATVAQRDQGGAPVLRIRRDLHETIGIEAPDHGRGCGLRETQPVREDGDRHRPVVEQDVEVTSLLVRQPGARETIAERSFGKPRRMEEQMKGQSSGHRSRGSALDRH
jgi:hypothetical protein